MSDEKLLILLQHVKGTIGLALNRLDAGMRPSVAIDMAMSELERLYRTIAAAEGLQPVNVNLDPLSIEMYARFALDALFGALKGDGTEAKASKAFWQSFHRCTRPSLKPQTT